MKGPVAKHTRRTRNGISERSLSNQEVANDSEEGADEHLGTASARGLGLPSISASTGKDIGSFSKEKQSFALSISTE